MRQLKPIPNEDVNSQDIEWELENCQDDIKRIIQICKKRNFEITPENAALAWALYSDSIFNSGWLILPSEDDLIFFLIAKHLEIYPIE
ncbi:MAG: hypothetical protein ACFFDT_25555 [Candidatus Hodarchaeota archaeon]